MKNFNSEKIRGDFPIFKSHPKLVYLNSAGSSQTPQVVMDAMEKYYTDFRANIHRGIYDLSQRATKEYEGAREIVADFIGASKEEIVFTGGSTISSNMLALSLEYSSILEYGDEIVVSIMEHHSNLLPWQQLAKRKNLTLKTVSITDNFEIDYEELKSLITDKTKIISIPLVSNVLGTISDIKKIQEKMIELAPNALLVVDATEAVGHIPVNVKDLDCDFMFFSGHKMCGPTGVGVLYGKKELLEKLDPSFFGGGMVSEIADDEITWNTSPQKFEAGTPNIAGVIGLGEAIKYLQNIGIENIHEHSKNLTNYAIEKLSEIKDLSIFAQKDTFKNGGVVSFTIEGIHPHDIAQVLADSNIAIRAGHHCALPLIKSLGVSATARVSFYLYNTKEDVNLLIETLNKTVLLFSK